MIISHDFLGEAPDCADLDPDGAVLVRINLSRGFVAGNTKVLPVRTARWLATLNARERRTAFKALAVLSSGSQAPPGREPTGKAARGK